MKNIHWIQAPQGTEVPEKEVIEIDSRPVTIHHRNYDQGVTITWYFQQANMRFWKTIKEGYTGPTRTYYGDLP